MRRAIVLVLVSVGFGAASAVPPDYDSTRPEVDSEESRAAGWRFYGGVNLETTVTKPDGQKQVYRFSPKGMTLQETDEQGQSTRHSYDGRNHLVKTIDPLGRETRHEYDAVGNRTASIDALGRRTDTSWDTVLNKPTQHTR